MRNKWLFLFGVMLVAALQIAPAVVRSEEAWPCNTLVVDDAGVLGDGVDDIHAVIDDLVALGAEVRVFTVKTTGLGNLDLFVDEIEQRCPSWRSSVGGIKENFIVVGISVEERKTGLYYGEMWFAALDDHFLRIQTEVMNPLFAEGDFSGGIVAGLKEIEETIARYLSPPAPTPAHVPTQPPATSVPVASSSGEPANRTGLWITLGVLGGLGAAGAASVGARRFFQARASKRAVRQKGRETKLKVASRILELQENITFLETDIEKLAQQVVGEELSGLREELASVERQVKQVDGDFRSVEIAGNDPDLEGLSLEEYEGFVASYEELLEQVEQAGEAFAQAQQNIGALDEIVARVPKDLEGAQSAIGEASERVGEVTRDRPNRLCDALIEQAQGKLEEARESATQKRPRKAVQMAAEAVSLAGRAVSTAQLLPELVERIDEVGAILDAGAATFEAIAGEFAESSWGAIRGNGTEAENRVEWAEDALQRAGELFAGPDERDWNEAQEQIDEATAWLDEAAELVESIEAAKRNLDAARRETPQEVQAAQEDIQKAGEYIANYDPDIREQLESELDTARGKLEAAQSELEEQEKPDFPQIIALAREANGSADRILDEARTEHEIIERLRGKYKSSLRDAELATSRAGRYLQDHLHDVSSNTRETLEQALGNLERAKKSRTTAEESEDLARRQALEEAVTLADKARDLATSAYSNAQREFNRAEAARRPAYVPVPATGSRPWGGWGSPRSSPPRRSTRPSSRPRERRGSSSSWSRSSSSSSRSRSRGGSSTSWRRSSSTRSRRGGGSSGW